MKMGYKLHKIAFSVGGKSDMGRWVGQKMAQKIRYSLWMTPYKNTYMNFIHGIQILE